MFRLEVELFLSFWGMNIFWNVPDGRAMRWVPLLVLLMLGFVDTSVAQETNAVSPSISTKTPGEQLIEFMTNPPENYDVGGYVVYAYGGNTNFFRVKKEGNNALFIAESENPSIMSGDFPGKSDLYTIVRGKYENEHYRFLFDSITTWTNRNIKIEEKNDLVLEEEEELINAEKNFLFMFDQEQLPTWKNANEFITNKGEQVLSNGSMESDQEGRITRIVEMYETPVMVGNEEMQGVISEFYYKKDVGTFFYPSEIRLLGIFEQTEDVKKENINRELLFLAFDHLNLSTPFYKKNFVLDVNEESLKKHFWISGENTLFVDHKSGNVKKLFAFGELEALEKERNRKQSRWRQLYVTLAIIFGLGITVLVLKKRNE